MYPAGFEPATPANERPQTYALDRAAIGCAFKMKVKPKSFGLEGARQAWEKLVLNKMLKLYLSVQSRNSAGATDETRRTAVRTPGKPVS